MLSGTDDGETLETVYLQSVCSPSASLQFLKRKLVSTYYYVEAYLRQVPSQKLTRLPSPINLTRDLTTLSVYITGHHSLPPNDIL